MNCDFSAFPNFKFWLKMTFNAYEMILMDRLIHSIMKNMWDDWFVFYFILMIP